MAVAACPKPETLAAFARGDLAAEELSTVASHVGACDACCRALKFVPEDSLAGLARAAAVVPPIVQPVADGAPPATGSPAAGGEKAIPAGFVDHPRYRIISRLGAGGMGTVYKAEDLLMGRVVALKVVSPHLTAKESAVARFRKEIRAVAQLQHQNIIITHDTGEAGGAQYLVMEFIDGVSLDRFVAKKGPLPVNMACLFARQAALGLQHAAEKGMVHRDIKPQNLMVTRKGQVKILDFGLARFASAGGESQPAAPMPFGPGKQEVDAGVTNPNLLMGTPDYLSPEQAKNSHDVDPRSDIYSLGCTLYFLLTGKPPFIGASTLLDKLLAHTHDEPPPVREERFEVTEGLAAVLAKMMAKKSEDRYQTAAEAAAALLPFTRSDAAKEPTFEIVEPVLAPPVVIPVPVATAVEPLTFDTDPVRNGPTLAELAKPKKKKKKRSWWRRHKRAVLGSAAALFLLVAAAVAANSGKKPTDNTADPNAGASVKGNTEGNPAVAPSAKGEQAQPNPWLGGTVVAPPKGAPKVLFVLPSSGVWLTDYTPVRKRLEANGVTAETASTDGGRAELHPNPKNLGESVPIDKRFSADMDLSEYSAVIFVGFNTDEYMSGRGTWAAKTVIQKMQQAGKPVAAICVGQGVLGMHGALRGKKAAYCPPLVGKDGDFARKSGLTWERAGVTVDGKVITAAGPEHAEAFADAVAAAIKGK